MKSNRILYAVIAILLLALAFVYRESRFGIREVASLNSIIEEKASELKTWKDKYDRERASRAAAEVTWAEAKIHYKEEIDALRRDLGVRSASSLGTIATVIRDTITLTRVDTVAVVDSPQHYLYKDEWLTLNAVWDGTYIHANYEIYDSIAFAITSTTPVWGKRKTRIEAITYNPSVNIVGLKSIVITDERRRWGIVVGPSIGVTTNGPYLGIGVTAGIAIR